MKKFNLLLVAFSFYLRMQAQSWSLTGNAGTNPVTNFVGTRDNNPLLFRINNRFAGKIDSVSGLSFLGMAQEQITVREFKIPLWDLNLCRLYYRQLQYCKWSASAFF